MCTTIGEVGYPSRARRSPRLCFDYRLLRCILEFCESPRTTQNIGPGPGDRALYFVYSPGSLVGLCRMGRSCRVTVYSVYVRLVLTQRLILTDARRHVNKMCMAANVPLVESGTAGYLGQVQPILKVRTPAPWHAAKTLILRFRIEPSASTASQNRHRRPSLCAQSALPHLSLYTA